MPRPQGTQTVVIVSGGTVSDAFVWNGKNPVGLWVPIVDSGNWWIKASWDATSANFFQLQNATGSGNYAPIIEAGSKAFSLDGVMTAFSNFKIETDTAQTDNRSIQIVTKP